MRKRNEKVLYSLFLLLIESIVKISCKIRLSEIYIFFTRRVWKRREFSLVISFNERGIWEEWERIWTCSNLFEKILSWGGKNLPILSPIWSKGSQKEFSILLFVKRRNCSFFFRIDIDEENSNFIIIFRKTNNDPTFRDFSWKDREREKGTQKTGQPTSTFHLVWKKGLPPFRKPGEFSSTILNFKLLYSP